jgi:putative transposase
MARGGLIHLQYLDESGFSRWGNNCYTYAKRGEQKCIEQPKERGKRVSILGIWEAKASFRYHLKEGSICQDEYLRVMEFEAQKAKERWLKTGCVTINVQDNSSVHWCKKVSARRAQWKKEGFWIFWLPPYASQLNRIEDEWHQIKAHEISGQMFESEAALLEGVHQGIKNRYQKKGCEIVHYV